MNKAWVYTLFATSLGLTMIVIPTLLFVKAGEDNNLAVVLQRTWHAESLSRQFLDYSDKDSMKQVSSKEVGTLGISFIVASAIYILSKRRRPRTDRVPPYIRHC